MADGIIEVPLTDTSEQYAARTEPEGVTRFYPTESAARENALVAMREPAIESVRIAKVNTAGIVRLQKWPVSTRPRIWLTPEIMAKKSLEAIPTNPDWMALYNEAVLELDPNRYGGMDNTINLAFVWQITGEARFADAAIAHVMTAVAKGPAAYSRDSGFDSRNVLTNMAVVYDWCHARLTPEQKTAIRAHIEGWCDWLLQPVAPGLSAEEMVANLAHMRGWIGIPEPPSAPAHPEDTEWRVPGAVPYNVNAPQGNYWMGHVLGLWLAALSLGEDSPKAADYLAAAKSKWVTQGLPYFEVRAKGGFVHDGTSYGAGTLFRMVFALEAHRTATGEDLMTPWVSEALTCKVHMCSPDNKFRVPFGDQSGNMKHGLTSYDIMPFLIYQSVRPNDPLAPILRDWIGRVRPTATLFWFARWVDFMWPVVGPSAPMIDTFWYAKGAGYATSRTGR